MTSLKLRRDWATPIILLILGTLMALSPTQAADDAHDAAKKDAVAAMTTWLGEMDAGSYAKSWTDAAKIFQKAIISDKWVEVSGKVRTPLGKLVSRTFATVLYQDGINNPNAKPLPGKFVIAQFDTSFENMKSARETVTFEQEDDGSWRAAGYFIKPQ
jgi:hypothetical protein